MAGDGAINNCQLPCLLQHIVNSKEKVAHSILAKQKVGFSVH